MRKVLGMLLVICIGVMLVACAKKSSFVGTWDLVGDEVSVIELKANGTGEIRTAKGSAKITTWKTEANYLHMWYDYGYGEVDNVYKFWWDDDDHLTLSQGGLSWQYARR